MESENLRLFRILLLCNGFFGEIGSFSGMRLPACLLTNPYPLKIMFRSSLAAALATTVLALPCSHAEIVFSEDFDGGGVNSVFTFTNSGGAPPAVVNSTVAPQANVAQITDLAGSTNNSIAFDAFSLASEQARITFEFRMSTDAANDGAGGCCAQAADGFGIGIFDTGTYGSNGGINPAAGTANWEDPNTGEGFPAAVVISFDVFDSGDGLGNHVRINGLGGPAESLGNFLAPFQLNNDLFHRAVLTFDAAGADTTLAIDLIEDVNGAATSHSLASGLTLTGVDLGAVSGRVIAGGRTGGAFVRTQLDNIVIETFQGDDSDLDGIPDFWEDQNGLDKNDPNDFDDDDDNDMLNNIGEFERNTDPQDPDTDDDTLSDLVETNTGTWVSATDRGTNPRSTDSDGDGLGDEVETNTGNFVAEEDTGTDPNVVDSDMDNFADGQEVVLGFDPTDDNSFPQLPITLGVGTGALLGGDLTDPENDGAPDSDTGYNAIFASSEEPGFGGGEFAFNVFDNSVGASNAKWCCGQEGGNFPTNPIWVQATFEEPISLTHFTLASGNDTEGRDPRVWELQGSNDGTNFETIHRQDDTNISVWGATRDLVLQWNAGIHFAPPAPYTTFRFICFATGLSSGARFQINEIELFGEPGLLTEFAITSIAPNAAGDMVTLTWNSLPNRTYALDTSTDMAGAPGEAWIEELDEIESDGESTSFTQPVPQGTERIFFRIRDVTP